jgi:beta-lactamase class A
LRILAAITLGLLLVCTATAQTTPQAPAPSSTASPGDIEKDRVDTMLRTGHADPAWFSASFLAQVPASKVDEIVASLVAALGPYQSLEVAPAKFVAHFAKGSDDVLIHLDADNKIDALFFRPPVTSTSSLDDALRAFSRLSGTVSYVIAQEGRPERAALDASAQLAIGSTFKLAALNALRDQIALGKQHWDNVFPLREQWKSLPTGVIRTWPSGTPLTLATYAIQMISISDNTAADTLVHLDGQDALRKYAGSNQPFLTTREMFILKSREGDALRNAYENASTPAQRRQILARVDNLPLPDLNDLLAIPDLAVEWHYSVRDLCRLMAGVADLPLMTINPGVADPHDFRRVAYKGGSDTGVINMTTMVTTKRGSKVCFSATLNDPNNDVNDSAFESAYRSVLPYIAAM